MVISVTKRFTFEACHYLPGYNGPCSKMHGHSYKLEVTVRGPIQKYGPCKGMVIDFREIKEFLHSIIEGNLDHSILNDIYTCPTAEAIAIDFFNIVSSFLKIHYPESAVERIRLWETEDSYAEVTNS